MVIQLLVGLIPILIPVIIWLWIFDSWIEPRARKWVGEKYQMQITRKTITKGYWWEVEGNLLTPFKIHLWAAIILMGFNWTMLIILTILTDKIIRLVTS